MPRRLMNESEVKAICISPLEMCSSSAMVSKHTCLMTPVRYVCKKLKKKLSHRKQFAKHFSLFSAAKASTKTAAGKQKKTRKNVFHILKDK